MAINLDSISNNTTLAPPRIVLHGPHGVGKTTFGASGPSPIVLPTEDGLGVLKVAHFPLLKSYDDVMEAIGALYEGNHAHELAVLDSADWLEPLVWAQTCKREKWDNIEAPGYGKGYLAADREWRDVLDGLNALRDKGLAVLVLAHSDIKRFNAPDTEPYDRYQIKLQTRAAALLEEWADCVLFANHRVHIVKADGGFNKKIARGTGTGERVLFTEERPAFKAKNRYSLPPELPLDWDAFAAALSPQPEIDAA